LDVSQLVKTSKDKIALAFTTCVALVNMWAVFNLLETIPSWVLQLNAWEIIGGISYTLTFALIESVFLFVLVMIVNFIVPKQFFAEKFILNSTILALLIFIWAILVQKNYDSIISLDGKTILFLLSTILLSIVIVIVIANHIRNLEVIISAIVNRVAILAVIYLILDILGILIVITRNL
jgi:hypothetical protein